jgi:hypothetical protein
MDADPARCAGLLNYAPSGLLKLLLRKFLEAVLQAETLRHIRSQRFCFEPFIVPEKF